MLSSLLWVGPQPHLLLPSAGLHSLTSNLASATHLGHGVGALGHVALPRCPLPGVARAGVLATPSTALLSLQNDVTPGTMAPS